jgi:hypothetical protein
MDKKRLSAQRTEAWCARRPRVLAGHDAEQQRQDSCRAARMGCQSTTTSRWQPCCATASSCNPEPATCYSRCCRRWPDDVACKPARSSLIVLGVSTQRSSVKQHVHRLGSVAFYVSVRYCVCGLLLLLTNKDADVVQTLPRLCGPLQTKLGSHPWATALDILFVRRVRGGCSRRGDAELRSSAVRS